MALRYTVSTIGHNAMKTQDELYIKITEAYNEGLPLSRAALLYGLTPAELLDFEKEHAVELAKLDAARELSLLKLHGRARTNAANKGQSRPIEVALGWLDPSRYGQTSGQGGAPAAHVNDDI